MSKWVLLRESLEQFRTQEFRIAGTLVAFVISMTLFSLIVIESTAKVPKDNPARLIYFVMFGETMLVVSTLCPGFLLWATCNERSSKTLEQLRTTLVKPSLVLMGKVLVLIFQILFFMTLCFPFIYMIHSSSGMHSFSLISHSIIICLSALSFGSVSLFWSYVLRRNQSAVFASFLTIGTFLLGPVFVPLVLKEVYKVKIEGSVLTFIISSVSPLYSLFRGDGLTLDWTPLTMCCLQHFLLSILLLCVVYIRLRSIMGGSHGSQDGW